VTAADHGAAYSLDPDLMRLLPVLREPALPPWHLVAGRLYQMVWTP
jgi:hypothetical protein